MNKKRITAKMKEFQKILGIRFKNLDLLCDAMNGEKTELNDHFCDPMATVGDAILATILADRSYSVDNCRSKEGITAEKGLADNDIMYRLAEGEGWNKYIYTSKHFYGDEGVPDHELVPFKKGHFPHIEAIVAAIYYDRGFEKTKKWAKDKLRPLLIKYKNEPKPHN